MKKNNFIVTFFATLLLSTFAYAKDITITGAGATFVAPLISKWSEEYKKISGNSINYASIGSSGGVKQIREKTVDFGATDAPLKVKILRKMEWFSFQKL